MSDSVVVDEFVYPWDKIEPYRGKWVALRGNGSEIVAAADKLADLYADERVRRGDTIWRVPEADVVHFYSTHAAA